MADDDQLMQRVAAGDLGAFDELVRRHQHSVWAVACRFTGDPVEAEDLAQDTFLRILTAADRYQSRGSFRSYLFTVLNRLCLDWAGKKRPVYGDAVPDPCDPSPTPIDRAVARSSQRRVQLALDDLPENQRSAIILRYYENMSYCEIARVMKLSEKSVERLLARARDRLKKTLRPERPSGP